MTGWNTGDYASVEEAAEAAVRKADQEREKLRGFHQKMDDETSTVRAKDRTMSMTFDGRGELVGMKFIGTRFRAMAPAKLAEVIVETVRTGRAQCMEKLAESVELRLPGVNLADLVAGKADPEQVLNSMMGSIFEELGDLTKGMFDRSLSENEPEKENKGKAS